MGITRYPWLSLGVGLLLGAAVFAAVAIFGPGGEDGLWDGVRLTGRVSFLLFLVPLVARPLDILIGGDWTRSLVVWRGNFGLAFAGNHIAHLFFIIALYQTSATAPVSEAVRWGGILGMLDLAAMTVLTFQTPVRWVGPRVTAVVHRVALHYLIFIFLYDIVLKNPIGSYPILTTLWTAAVGVRIAAWVVEARRPSSAAVASAAS